MLVRGNLLLDYGLRLQHTIYYFKSWTSTSSVRNVSSPWSKVLTRWKVGQTIRSKVSRKCLQLKSKMTNKRLGLMKINWRYPFPLNYVTFHVKIGPKGWFSYPSTQTVIFGSILILTEIKLTYLKTKWHNDKKPNYKVSKSCKAIKPR